MLGFLSYFLHTSKIEVLVSAHQKLLDIYSMKVEEMWGIEFMEEACKI